ncbi:hypothetical protein KKC32_04800 [Patescibacteria group bacterium]|nr:hypothetical protein [Patescibacteria group bacterium]
MFEKPPTKEKIAPRRVEATKLTWAEMKEKISRDKDEVIAIRKREVLDALDFDAIFLQIPIVTFSKVKRFKMIRGYVFEALANHEFNNEEENGILGNFILRCLKNPKILGMQDLSFNNPDHLGVVVDIEKRIAYITGMYEVKLSDLGTRGRRQLTNFYKNLNLISSVMNEKLAELKEKYDLKFLPEGGVVLKSISEIEKFVVVPNPDTDSRKEKFDRKKKSLEERGWELKSSLFSITDIEDVTLSLFAHYNRNSETIDKKRKSINQ